MYVAAGTGASWNRIGLIYMVDYKLAPLMICLLVLFYFAAFMTAYYLLINGKQSMVRNADNAM